MAEYLSKHIVDLINDIEAGRIVLPAMQRNFVWPEEKIYRLFDSLMRDIPIGTFLFWEIDKKTFDSYVFNKFIKDVDEQKKLQRGDPCTAEWSDYIAVLDGQQRITSLYMGAKGKYRTHIKGKFWEKEESYYIRKMCFDILHIPSDEEDKYNFLFVDEDYIRKITTYGNEKDDLKTIHYWVTISDIIEEDFDPSDFIDEFDEENPNIFDVKKRKAARKNLETLRRAFWNNNNVNYYPAKNKSLPEVVDIFVRVNSGGQKLSASDLMLSVATGQMGDIDIHTKMQDTINVINKSAKDEENGFKVDKELVLTAGLMFTGADSLSLQKKENYSADRMNTIFSDKWDEIEKALSETVKYIEYLGFSGKKLTSKNLALPLAYYFYLNKLNFTQETGTSSRAKCDFIFVRQWFLRAMMNNVFSDATGGTLIRIREVIKTNDKKYFPLDELMKKEIKKTLDIGPEQVEEILELEYGDTRVIPILSEIAKDSTRSSYDADHIWPKSSMLTKKAIRTKYPTASDLEIDFYRGNCNRIANLQMLPSQVNKEKSDTDFEIWVKSNHPDTEHDSYYDVNCIPLGISYSYKYFEIFVQKRTNLLKSKIVDAFPNTFDEIVKRFNLEDNV